MATAVATPPAAPADGEQGIVARLGAQKQKFKSAFKAMSAERDAAKTQIAELTKKLEALEKAGGPAKIAELEGKLREQSHRGKFTELAREAGCEDPKALEDLWEKSGYKAEGDAPDEAKIKTAIEATRKERSYLFNAAPQNAEGEVQHGYDPFADAPIEPPKPGPGRGQGGTRSAPGGTLGLTQQQLRDPAWMFANQDAIAKAAAAAINLPKNQVPTKLAIMG